MIVTDKFIWMHLPKTGGTWFRVTVLPHLGAAGVTVHFVEARDHRVARDLPHIAPHLVATPRFWFIRNPWGWWVSLYHFWHKAVWSGKGEFAKPRSERDPANRWWGDLLEPFGRTPSRRAFEYAIRSYYVTPRTAGKPWYHSQAMIHAMMEAPPEAPYRLGRFEFLRADATELLAAHLAPRALPGELERALQEAAPVNTSDHDGYRDLYSEATRRFIENIEAPIIEHGRYVF